MPIEKTNVIESLRLRGMYGAGADNQYDIIIDCIDKYSVMVTLYEFHCEKPTGFSRNHIPKREMWVLAKAILEMIGEEE